MPAPYTTLISTDALNRVRAPLPQASTLPPTAYTDPAVFDAERRAIFTKDWLCVARIDQLEAVGDYVCVDLPDQPIVVVRVRDRELRALSRVCLHRAMPVAQGRGNATRFVCPYHNWTYELDGQLRSAPMMDDVEGFDANGCTLPRIALEVWQGFVFVNLSEAPAPLAPQLTGLTALLENYGFADMAVVETIEYDSPWNWKILVENFMEAYHHIGTHKQTFEPNHPGRDSHIPDNDGQPWVVLNMPGKAEPAEADIAFPNLIGEQRKALVAVCVYPTLLFAASAAGAAWYQLDVAAHDQMNLKIHALAPAAARPMMDEAARAAVAQMLRTIHEEDIEANAGPWRGLHGALTNQGRLSLYEKSIWQLNQLWLERLERDA